MVSFKMFSSVISFRRVQMASLSACINFVLYIFFESLNNKRVHVPIRAITRFDKNPNHIFVLVNLCKSLIDSCLSHNIFRSILFVFNEILPIVSIKNKMFQKIICASRIGANLVESRKTQIIGQNTNLSIFKFLTAFETVERFL